MDQSSLNFIFEKSIATGITTVATDIDNTNVATGVDDIIITIANILLFTCARAPKP
jgi:hypothetical protein